MCCFVFLHRSKRGSDDTGRNDELFTEAFGKALTLFVGVATALALSKKAGRLYRQGNRHHLSGLKGDWCFRLIGEVQGQIPQPFIWSGVYEPGKRLRQYAAEKGALCDQPGTLFISCRRQAGCWRWLSLLQLTWAWDACLVDESGGAADTKWCRSGAEFFYRCLGQSARLRTTRW